MLDEPTKRTAGGTRFAAGALIIVALVVATVAVGVAALVFGAYGCGLLVARWLPFSPFEATVVSLLALVATLVAAAKLLARAYGWLTPVAYVERCAVCGRYHDGDDHEVAEDDEAEDDLEEGLTPNDGLRAVLFASGAVKPNAPCPCGSGLRYGKCCGDGRLFRRGRAGTRLGSP